MSLSQLEKARQRDIAADREGVNSDGSQVSVADLQRALRSVLSPTPQARVRGEARASEQQGRGEAAFSSDERADREAPSAASGQASEFDSDWIAVIAGHPGAGASTLALAIADALSARGSQPRLIETAPPTRSSLIAAATAELGTDLTGSWNLGSRGRATLFRRATGDAPLGWPSPAPAVAAPSTGLTVVDLGHPGDANLSRLRQARSRTVLVSRVTVPGLRLTEQILNQLDPTHRVYLAAVGNRRWPGPVAASAGPRLRALRGAGHVVPIPCDGRLEAAGLTGAPLPASTLKAAARLLDLLDAIPSGPSPRQQRPPAEQREAQP